MADSTAAKPVATSVQFWLGEIAAARKREKDWRKEGKRILDIYNGKKKDSIPFNILYSNTETLLPAVYNSDPRPVVQRRFKDDDPLGKASSMAGQRMLEFTVDTNSEEYASFSDVVTDAVLDALLPGRGGSRAKYDAKIVGEGTSRYVAWELVCFESLKWDRWIHGYAKKWKRVPWVAFEHDITVEEATTLFGKAVADKLQFSSESHASDDKEDDNDKDEDTDEDLKVAKVWEIWVRQGHKVIFVSPNYTEGFLKEDEDPLELTGFFPMPEPIRFLRKTNDLAPTPLYSLYENQAKELNRISVRINRIAEALKVRGVYDGQLSDIENVLKAGDNEMVSAENVAALQEGGLEKAIWIFPLDKLITVLQQLFIARNNCKQVIYEITGISDILRGSTVASETATAQQIKSQWGTLRLKRLQREAARYARELLRISLEIASKKFSEQTFASMTGLPFATTPQVQAANAQVAAARSMLATSQPQALVNPQAAQQALATAVPEAMQTLAKPAWDAVLKLLKDNTQRQYRVDIETNSTVDVEATEDQKQMGEVLTAMSQFIQGITPLVVSGSMPFQVAQSMLLAVVRRYRMGSEIEDYVKQMKAPADPNAGKAQADQAKQAAEVQKMQAETQRANEAHNQEMQQKQADASNAQQLASIELEVKREEARLKREELVAKAEFNKLMAQIKLREAEGRIKEAEELSRIKIEQAKAMPKKESSNAAT